VGLHGEVGQEEPHAVVAGLPADVREGRLAAPAVAANEAERRAAARELEGRRAADAGRGAGDQAGAVSHDRLPQMRMTPRRGSLAPKVSRARGAPFSASASRWRGIGVRMSSSSKGCTRVKHSRPRTRPTNAAVRGQRAASTVKRAKAAFRKNAATA